MKPYRTEEPKGTQMRSMFDRIAPRYDLLNHTLSLGIDRGWRRKLVHALERGAPGCVLDVATGTADLAIGIVRGIPGTEVTGVDLSPGMIEVGMQKVADRGLTERVELQVADVAALPFAGGEFDAVTAAFGVRNFENIEGGLREMARVVRPGGMAAILEFSTPRGKIIPALYRFYFHRVLPVVGGWVSGDREAYRYLPLSVDGFPTPDAFVEMLRGAGFTDCHARALSGGIAYLYTGVKNNLQCGF